MITARQQTFAGLFDPLRQNFRGAAAEEFGRFRQLRRHHPFAFLFYEDGILRQEKLRVARAQIIIGLGIFEPDVT